MACSVFGFVQLDKITILSSEARPVAQRDASGGPTRMALVLCGESWGITGGRDISTALRSPGLHSSRVGGDGKRREIAWSASMARQSTQRYTACRVPQQDPCITKRVNGQWLLRNSNTPGNPDIVTVLGYHPSDVPIVGNWQSVNH